MNQANVAQYQISFVVPVYNVEPYLTRCLESIIRVNVEKEIILIDDGSTDGGLKILEDYQQKYPYITLVCQQNIGVSAARNIGIKLARGKYLQFVDPDDYLLTEDYAMLLKLADMMKSQIFRGQYSQYIFDKFNFKSGLVFDFIDQVIVTKPSYEFLDEALKKAFIPSMWRHIYKTSYIQENQILFNETLKASEDMLFVFEAFSIENVNVTEINLPIYAYSIRPYSVVTTFDFEHFESLFKATSILQDKYQEYKRLNEKEKSDWCSRLIVYNYHFAYQCYKSHSDEIKAKVRHFFTKSVIYSLESSYKYKVEL